MEEEDDDDETEGGEDDDNCGGGGGGSERQREHPFIVTEPGEVARGKKNGLDYLFHLYEQCREFLIQVQTIAKERGEKCPSKVCLNSSIQPDMRTSSSSSVRRYGLIFLPSCPYTRVLTGET